MVQTIYIDEEDELEAVAIDEGTGKLATCSLYNIYIYQPYAVEYGVYKVSSGRKGSEAVLTKSSGRCRAA